MIPKFKFPLWKHQESSIEDFFDKRSKALFYEMGCGKTLTAIGCLRQKNQQQERILKTLIICPLIVVENWYRELLEHLPAKQACLIQKLEGTGKQRLKQLSDPKKQIFVTNFESLRIPGLFEELLRQSLEFLVVDESHKAKNPKAQVSKALHRLSDKIQNKLILTGSPVLNDYLDLWSQFRILGRDICGDNFYAFRAKYFYDKNAAKSWLKFPDWVPKPNCEQYLSELIHKHGDRVTKEEVLELPPLTKQTVFVDLTPELKRHYLSMESDFLTAIDDEVVKADIVLTKLLRLQQIVCGILPTENGIKREASAKLSALCELLEDLCPRNKVIVWSNFVACIDDIAKVCDDLGLYFVTIEGGQKPRERQEAIDAFNNSPKVSVCVANQAAGGVGIGLQAASYMIYYSKQFNLEHDIQSESRAHRGGSEVHEKITRIDIVTRGTIEEDITEALRRKEEMGELLFRLRGERRKAA